MLCFLSRRAAVTQGVDSGRARKEPNGDDELCPHATFRALMGRARGHGVWPGNPCCEADPES